MPRSGCVWRNEEKKRQKKIIWFVDLSHHGMATNMRQMMLNLYHRAIERRLAFDARTEAPVLGSEASSARLD